MSCPRLPAKPQGSKGGQAQPLGQGPPSPHTPGQVHWGYGRRCTSHCQCCVSEQPTRQRGLQITRQRRREAGRRLEGSVWSSTARPGSKFACLCVRRSLARIPEPSIHLLPGTWGQRGSEEGRGLWAEGLGPTKTVWSALLKAVGGGERAGETVRSITKPSPTVEMESMPQTACAKSGNAPGAVRRLRPWGGGGQGARQEGRLRRV